MTAPPSRGRRRPEPAIPVGGGGDGLAPPEPFNPLDPTATYNPLVLASTDPTEAPPPKPPPGVEGEEDRRKVVEEDEEEEVIELSPEEQVMFASLMTCGRRSKTLHLMDHTVVVQTLCGDDDLRIGLYVKEYAGSLGEQRAYQIGVAAAGIRTIDGVPIVQPLYENAGEDALFSEKIMKVAAMYPSVISKIYRAVMDAEKEFVELATRLGKLSG